LVIDGYQWLLIFINICSIGGYYWLFYYRSLVVILLMAIDDYFVGGY